MCGRKWRRAWEISLTRLRLRLAKMPVSNLPPRYNVAPTQTYEIVYRDAQGERVMEPFRWGLIPTFMRDRKSAARCINARAETIATLPSFRSAFGKRRCLVPASGYYEWKVTGPKTKQPYAIAATNADDMLVFAGLWETWTDPETQEVVRTYSIATTEPGPDVVDVHDRQPVVLSPETWSTWLGESAATKEELLALLAPSPPGTLRAWPIGQAVGKVANDDPSLIEPIAMTEPRLL